MLFQLRQYFPLHTMSLSWYGCTTLCLIIHPLKVIWLVSAFELLCIKLLWILMYRFLCEHKFLFLWHTCPRGQFLGFIMPVAIFSFKRNYLGPQNGCLPVYISTSNIWVIYFPLMFDLIRDGVTILKSWPF